MQVGRLPVSPTGAYRLVGQSPRNLGKQKHVHDCAGQLRYLVRMHRRDFLQLATVASACAATPTDIPKYRIVSRFEPSPKPGMPGPFPGKVVRVHSEKSVNAATQKVDARTVGEMLSRG